MTGNLLEIAWRYARNAELSALSGAIVSATSVMGVMGSGLFGVIGSVDPVFIVTAIIGAVSLAGNAWIEYQWRMRRRRIDAVDYERRKKLDLQLYEKRLEKESGFDLDVINTPDPDGCFQPATHSQSGFWLPSWRRT